MAEASRLVLDTSAVLAMRSDEPGADRVERLLRAARSGRATVLLSFMTRMELLCRIASDEGQEQAESAVRLLDAAGVEWVSGAPGAPATLRRRTAMPPISARHESQVYAITRVVTGFLFTCHGMQKVLGL